jgi:hypothetical protein
MITFLEYFKGDKYMNPMQRSGKNLYGGVDRKHQNNVKKEYNSKCPHVNNLLNGGAAQIKLMGAPLMQTLSSYNMDYQPGTVKVLGNSGVEVKMYEDGESNQCGILTRR